MKERAAGILLMCAIVPLAVIGLSWSSFFGQSDS